MKKAFITTILSIVYLSAFSQEKLVKDIDFDGKKDTIYVDETESKIICRLSTQNFRKLKSGTIETLHANSPVEGTKNGFEFRNNWMRSGYAMQFRYEKNEKRIRLIGMSDYAFGNAAGDGSGESSINLLTGDYIGLWNYYDHNANNEKGALIKIPAAKAKIYLKKTYLEDIGDNIYYTFTEKRRPIDKKQETLERNRRNKK
ncbi:hypothetical protein [Pedobacter xixiisoli]|uniref:Uncharacterized protein n=1 Tax=Pedobacter xixiisoli TaxID=1476464 RepID=A0A286A8V8_9SPHI|nr:hypothetical protein [Pedobacter xixiisoli]SOD18344.1 hypothetical protein SAMN06297358_2952 [Pedobacter xixiisoli]